MSKRSRNAPLLLEANDSLTPPVENERDMSETSLPPSKYSELDADAVATQPAKLVQCTLAPHREIVCFDTQEEYETHYAKEHASRCATCSKNFPTARFLELHLEENHSALQEVLAVRGEKTYGCFVEDCNKKCSTPLKRRLHVVDKHMFPKTYNFRIVDEGIDERSSMLGEGRKRRVSTAINNRRADRYRRQASSGVQHELMNASNDIENSAANLEPHKTDASGWATKQDEISKGSCTDLNSLTSSLSTLRFTPMSVLQKRKEKSVYLETPRSEVKVE